MFTNKIKQVDYSIIKGEGLFMLEECRKEELEELKMKGELELDWIEGDKSYPVYKIVNNSQIQALIQYSELDKAIVQIDLFEVLKSKRRKKIGSNIIKIFMNSFSNAVFCLYPNNEKAVKFWEYRGYIKQDDGSGTYEWVFKR